MEEEMVDVVDNDDRVVGKAPRKGIHKTDLMHRSVHIFLFDPEGRIWLERRADNTDTFPDHYSSSAAGHVSHGESYLQGAEREALEELGIDGLRLEQKHKLAASKDTSNEFVMFYTAKSEAVPVAHENTKNLQAFTIEQIERMRAGDEKFVPIFLILFDWYKKNV
jgi:16S rRNA (adenine1518-N6/adenine1519-N6)-dimethyltransferase